jgi:hypothetical protein
VSPAAGTRIVCYCNDCQAFARFLGRPGIIDAWGGTDIFQLAPARVRIDRDDDALGCVRLSDKGMHRWYCRHCKTPVANTLGAGVPFVGLIHAFIDRERLAVMLDELLGEPIGFIHTRSAVGGVPPHATRRSLLRVLARSARMLAKSWLTGAGAPSPFFDEKTRAPRAQPRVLSADERRAL